jgi:hypothetical protein
LEASSRSSIIVSDEPLSGETNYRTEFVAVLSHQPQGGFITRPRTPPMEIQVASGNDDFFGFMFPRSPQPQPRYAPQRGGQQPYPQTPQQQYRQGPMGWR